MPHWRKRYHVVQTGWIEAGTAAIIGWLGVIAYFAVFGLFIYAMFATIPKARAATACQSGQIAGVAELAKELGIKPSTNNAVVAQGCDGKSYDVVELIRAHVALMRKVRK